MRNTFPFLIFLGLLLGCAPVTTLTLGRDIDPGKVKAISKGETTKEELLRLFGPPAEKGLTESGLERWRWRYERVERVREGMAVLTGPDEEIKALKRTLEVILEGERVRHFLFYERTLPGSLEKGYRRWTR